MGGLVQPAVDSFERIATSTAARKEPDRQRFSVASVAVLSDVHANVHALRAVLGDLERAPVELVVFSGDITWGPFPQETVAAIRDLRTVTSVALVRGNADRAVLELADGVREPETARDGWMLANHRASDLELLRSVRFDVEVALAGVGLLRICHGSPRADIEALTPETTPERMAAACADLDADVLITGHTHIQFDRPVHGHPRLTRHLNPGSVGLPYHTGDPGARWARIDGNAAEVFDLKTTSYDLDAHLAAIAATDDPRRDVIAGLLRTPPSPAEIIEDAEARVFAD
jgi:putative phosphoesterase